MPRNTQEVKRLEELSLTDREKQPLYSQEHWYLLASYLVNSFSVLDVGSGSGSGIPILEGGGATNVLGIDLLPASTRVQRIPVEQIRDKSFDIVTSFDVIEHVEEDRIFLKELIRVACKAVIISTPNWDTWHCSNIFHVREYTPKELADLLLYIGSHRQIGWTCGIDRRKDPVSHINLLTEAKASFCTLIGLDDCTDSEWERLQKAAKEAPPLITDRLSNLTKTAEEWTSECREICNSITIPLNRATELLAWLSSHIIHTNVHLKIDDPIRILRYGQADERQQAILIAWLLNTFVLGPNGPYVNQC